VSLKKATHQPQISSIHRANNNEIKRGTGAFSAFVFESNRRFGQNISCSKHKKEDPGVSFTKN